MTTYVRAWAKDGALFFVTTSPEPITFDNYQGPHDVSFTAEIDGEFLPASDLMPILAIQNGALSGIDFVSQASTPGPVETPEQLAARLSAWRETAFLSKATFLKAIVAAGILPQSEMVEAAKGNVPASFAAIINAMSPAAKAEAETEWAAVANITRNNAFINDVAAAAGIPAATLDAIFGWQG